MKLLAIAIFLFTVLGVSQHGAFLRSARGAFIRSPHGVRDFSEPIREFVPGIYVVADVGGLATLLGFNYGTFELIAQFPISGTLIRHSGLSISASGRIVYGSQIFVKSGNALIPGPIIDPQVNVLAAQQTGLNLFEMGNDTRQVYAGQITVQPAVIAPVQDYYVSYLVGQYRLVSISNNGTSTRGDWITIPNPGGPFANAPPPPIPMPSLTFQYIGPELTPFPPAFAEWVNGMSVDLSAEFGATTIDPRTVTCIPNADALYEWSYWPDRIGEYIAPEFATLQSSVWYIGTQQVERNASPFGFLGRHKWGVYEFGSPPRNQMRTWIDSFTFGRDIPAEFNGPAGAASVRSFASTFARLA